MDPTIQLTANSPQPTASLSPSTPVMDPMDGVAPVAVPTTVVATSASPVAALPSDTISSSSVLAQPIVQAQATLPSVAPGGAAKGKEMGPVASQELAGFVETVGSDSLEQEPLPPEVASWMEKVDRDASGEKPPEIVVADAQAQTGVGNYSSEPVFVLPLGQAQVKAGMHQSVNDSVRWLAEWCGRVLKKLGSQATFSG